MSSFRIISYLNKILSEHQLTSLLASNLKKKNTYKIGLLSNNLNKCMNMKSIILEITHLLDVNSIMFEKLHNLHQGDLRNDLCVLTCWEEVWLLSCSC